MLDITEKNIMKQWDLTRYSEPIVTIVCLSYNHENYIQSAIEGFLTQKTKFPFKIFIHDDCSEDNTRTIIHAYEKKYPNIIDAVYEENNLFSQGFCEIQKVIRSHVKSKYQALCEGDDYWTDTNKLQKQIDYLEQHEKCTLTISNGKIFNVTQNKYLPVFSEEEIEYSKKNRIITLNNFYKLKFPPTASYVYRRECVEDIEENMPNCPAQDMRVRLYLLTKGYAYYFKDEMCVYRMEVPGSETTKWKRYDKKAQRRLSTSFVMLLNTVNNITEGVYEESIWKMKSQYIINIISNSSLLIWFKYNDEYKRAFYEISFIKKVKLILKMVIPNSLYQIYLVQKRGN